MWGWEITVPLAHFLYFILTERIKQLEEEKSRIEMEMARVSHEATSLRSELERRPPLDFDPATTKV